MRSILFMTVVSVGACGGKAAPATTSQSSDLLTADEMVGLCVKLHTEVTSCAREFVGLNIDLRIQYSPQFADAMKDPAVRAQAEEEGAAETVADAANAQARCTEFARPEWGPAQPRADVATLDGCYAQPTCDAKMVCLRPLIEPRFAYRAEHDGPH
jgi:hypothetical protein